ncbi:MAG: hypothetical protein ACXWT0_01565 [Methylobacter sp.]
MKTGALLLSLTLTGLMGCAPSQCSPALSYMGSSDELIELSQFQPGITCDF